MRYLYKVLNEEKISGDLPQGKQEGPELARWQRLNFQNKCALPRLDEQLWKKVCALETVHCVCDLLEDVGWGSSCCYVTMGTLQTQAAGGDSSAYLDGHLEKPAVPNNTFISSYILPHLSTKAEFNVKLKCGKKKRFTWNEKDVASNRK